MMWVVYEFDTNGFADELVRVIGPFDNEQAADAYCTIHNLDGVMRMETPVVESAKR